MTQKSTLLLRATLTAIVAAVLVWQVTTRSLVAYLASSEPETALSLRSTDPTALLILADRRLAHIQQLEQQSTPPPSQTEDKAQGVKEPQPNLGQLAELGLKPPETPAPLNLFMNIPVLDGNRIEFRPPVSTRGSHVALRAEMDCILAFSACPQDMIPINGQAMRPTEAHFEVLG